jgi:hypothetical protein
MTAKRPPRSIHDNLVDGTEIDARQRRIVLHTRYDAVQPAELTDVVFEGVLAYRFADDNFQTVLFGIEEFDVERLVDEEREAFERGRKYGWPGPWNESAAACVAHFKANGAKAYEISSA